MSEHPILAIDHGEARIGLAATDEFGIGAHPVETVDEAPKRFVSLAPSWSPDSAKFRSLILTNASPP